MAAAGYGAPLVDGTKAKAISGSGDDAPVGAVARGGASRAWWT